jgi:hypothetical protein
MAYLSLSRRQLFFVAFGLILRFLLLVLRTFPVSLGTSSHGHSLKERGEKHREKRRNRSEGNAKQKRKKKRKKKESNNTPGTCKKRALRKRGKTSTSFRHKIKLQPGISDSFSYSVYTDTYLLRHTDKLRGFPQNAEQKSDEIPNQTFLFV